MHYIGSKVPFGMHTVRKGCLFRRRLECNVRLGLTGIAVGNLLLNKGEKTISRDMFEKTILSLAF